MTGNGTGRLHGGRDGPRPNRRAARRPGVAVLDEDAAKGTSRVRHTARAEGGREPAGPGARRPSGPEHEEHEGRSRRGRKLPALLAVGWATVAGGCIDPGGDCWTRGRIEASAQAAAKGPILEIRAGVVAGEVAREDPDNWWTGLQFTGTRCEIEVEHRRAGTYVRTGFLATAAKLEARLGPADAPFFVGRTADGGAVVLQHHQGRPVSLTLTRFEENGDLSYGTCGEDDTPFFECHAGASRE